ncbi:hypothetical protein FVE85_0819 [Porphyridium purpureum]|uniref:Uncharacterized protein n=1 Tax=Porphyridium purpureum TaxID=35688 RepID=A0A5J4Z1D7_PORPP|nr:hypothetical protein FVE85_0819 [Porphyridium purpureum]|eukprot:POR0884..scf208_2
MVTAQKLVAENLQTVLAMVYFTLGLSNLLGHEFPAGMFRALSAFPGAHWLTQTNAARLENKTAIVSLCAVMLVSAMATYSREQLLALVVLWTMQSWLCSRAGVLGEASSDGKVQAETLAYAGSTRLFFWMLWILLCVQIYCVFYVLVRKKAKLMRQKRDEAPGSAPPGRTGDRQPAGRSTASMRE